MIQVYEVYALRDNGDNYYSGSFTDEDAAIDHAEDMYRFHGFEYVVVEGDLFLYTAIIHSTTGEEY